MECLWSNAYKLAGALSLSIERGILCLHVGWEGGFKKSGDCVSDTAVCRRQQWVAAHA